MSIYQKIILCQDKMFYKRIYYKKSINLYPDVNRESSVCLHVSESERYVVKNAVYIRKYIIYFVELCKMHKDCRMQ